MFSTQNENLARQNLLTDTMHKSANIVRYKPARKRYKFDPLLTSLMKKALLISRETPSKLKLLRVQRAIKLFEWIKIRRETTVLQS